MIILTIRTDKPASEIGLFDGQTQLQYEIWEAHRALGETIHLKIKALLEAQKLDLHAVQGIIGYEGPGSFTGLRIGLSVANALANALAVPIVAQTGEDWAQKGIDRLLQGADQKVALPEYGAPVHITPPKH
jgi:tRNA threonylcarbamoyladenosine biosynthesis protein TsaB